MASKEIKLMVIGFLKADPEMRFTPSGLGVTNFSMATEHKVNEQEVTDWWNFVAFGKTAEMCNEYLHKGSYVKVDGRPQWEEWKDKETGETKKGLKIVVDHVLFLDRKGDNGDAPATNGKTRNQPVAVAEEDNWG